MERWAIYASILGVVVFVIAFIVHTHNAWVFLALYSLSYIGLALFSLICWAMITDVINDTEVRTGSRVDGEIYSVYSFARKLGQAASSGLTGLLLTMIGYTQATQFEESVTNGIYNITCLVPAIGYVLLAVVLKFLYPLNKKTVEANSAELARRRGEFGRHPGEKVPAQKPELFCRVPAVSHTFFGHTTFFVQKRASPFC